PIYLECLKGMTSYSLTNGINSIFFPGGTRSRSGATESKVKLGLIGSLVEAQRLYLESEKSNKIFVVTMNIDYHFVLEAKHLIDQYLRQIGKEKYVSSRDLPSFMTYVNFLKIMLIKESEVYISLGKPMDVFGNKINESGESIDKFGNVVQLKDYFITDGVIKADQQRESIYTRLLGDAVVHEYQKNQIVLSSNIISFVAFQIMLNSSDTKDVVTFITTKASNEGISYKDIKIKCKQLIDTLNRMAENGQIILSPILQSNAEIDDIINDGLENLGIYHAKSPLKKDKDVLYSEDLSLLFFYHNRLTNYPLHESLDWVTKISVD
ncbi:MAG: glycerol acyltransferase, partial [Saprospiraceae bacterium]